MRLPQRMVSRNEREREWHSLANNSDGERTAEGLFYKTTAVPVPFGPRFPTLQELRHIQYINIYIYIFLYIFIYFISNRLSNIFICAEAIPSTLLNTSFCTAWNQWCNRLSERWHWEESNMVMIISYEALFFCFWLLIYLDFGEAVSAFFFSLSLSPSLTLASKSDVLSSISASAYLTFIGKKRICPNQYLLEI